MTGSGAAHVTREVAIVAPTASGKSDIAMAVARATGAHIIAVDAMQVYRGMDIGTAKPSPADQAAVGGRPGIVRRRYRFVSHSTD